MSSGWNTFLLLSFVGVVALIYFLYKKGYTLNMPGIPDSIRNFGHWDKVVGVAAAMIVVFMIIYLFDWMLPKLSEAYQLRGGPHYVLVLAAAVIALLGLIWPGRTRTTLLSIMGVLVGGAILTALLPAIWEVGFGGSASDAPVQTASRCDNIYRDYPLTNQPRPIPGNGCKMGWSIQTGGLMLIDRDGNKYGPYYKGDEVGFTPPAIQWMAGGGNAVVKARFY